MTLQVRRRSFLASIPTLIAAHRLLAQGSAPQIRVNGLSQMTLTVSDPKRSIEFYQRLFGMPIQARQGTTTFLRIGAGPRFLAIVPAAPGERPSISRFGMGVERFNVDDTLKALAQHGVTPEEAANTLSGAVAPMKVRVAARGNVREMFVADPSGIVFQLHDAGYCGGSGPLGDRCQPEPAGVTGLIAVKDMSHFTINSASAQFYADVFGMPVQVMQATTPAYAVGPGVHFLMFTGGGGRGATPARAAIDHACMALDDFVPDAVTKTLISYGLKPGARTDGPLVTYISLRLENRGGAPGTGTPELYFTDPDGLVIQLQDTKYCGGGGYLGDICPG